MKASGLIRPCCRVSDTCEPKRTAPENSKIAAMTTACTIVNALDKKAYDKNCFVLNHFVSSVILMQSASLSERFAMAPVDSKILSHSPKTAYENLSSDV